MDVSFYVNAGTTTGLGHIIRCIALADKLTEQGATCRFYGNYLARKIARDAGHKECLPLGFTYGEDMSVAVDLHSSVWIVDLEGGCPPALAENLHNLSQVLVILNGVGYPDGDPGRLVADLVFYQGVTERPHNLDWSGFRGAWHVGQEWVILRDGIIRRWRENHHAIPRIVVIGGGADIGGVSRRVIEAIDCHRHHVRVLIGPASTDEAEWPNYVQVVKSPDNIFEHLDWADIAIVSYGMTAFECLASGLPTVALSITKDHEDSAKLVEYESGYSLFSAGMVDAVSDDDISDAVEIALMSINQMSGNALGFVDLNGARRVAHKILEVAGGV